jgi:hypothetical protein
MLNIIASFCLLTMITSSCTMMVPVSNRHYASSNKRDYYNFYSETGIQYAGVLSLDRLPAD